MPVIVRAAVLNDLDAVCVMADNFASICPHIKPYGLKCSRDSLRATLHDTITMKNCCCFVGEQDGQLCGFICGHLTPWWLDASQVLAKELAWWVEPLYRGNGVASKLLTIFETWANINGAAVLVMASVNKLDGARVNEVYRAKEMAEEETSFFKKLPGGI